MSFKVVIPSAGLGSRIGSYSKHLNKALVTIGDKPAICRVIDKFDHDVPIVILTGYKGAMLKEVLLTIYPERELEFIHVDKFEGPESGLGYSMLKAEKALQCPFIFIPNDTIIGEDNINLDPNIHGNWIAYFTKTSEDQYNSEFFRCIELSENNKKVTGITGKGTLNTNIYIGICGVKDYENFWKSMHSDNAITEGEVFGLKSLGDLCPISINEWYDCGTLQYLLLAKEKFENPDHNILEKEDEAIWFIDERVIKFSIHEDFIKDRVQRLKYLPEFLIPKLLSYGKYTYTYKKIDGEVIANTLSPSQLTTLLNDCYEHLWSRSVEPNKDNINQCYKFYRDKSFSRLEHYLSRFEQIDEKKIINGIEVPSVKSLLDSVDWDYLCKMPNWAPFHGDFHGENILIKEDNTFSLLDWRQCFGDSSIEFGDTYYDLAKLKHGLLVNHGVVHDDGFTIKEYGNNEVFISILQHSNLIECLEEYDKWLELKSFKPHKVNLLNALIYLNVCGLHDYPYAKFLYLYGQHLLYKELSLINN